MMAATLYDLTAEMRIIEDAIDRAEQDGVGELEATTYLYQLLLEGDGQLGEKLERYARLVKNAEAYAEMLKQEAARLTDRAKAQTNRAKRLKDAVHWALTTLGIGKHQAGPHEWRIQANGGKAPLAIDEAVTPETVEPRFQRVEVAFEIDAIRSALEAGEDVPWARLAERGTHVRLS